MFIKFVYLSIAQQHLARACCVQFHLALHNQMDAHEREHGDTKSISNLNELRKFSHQYAPSFIQLLIHSNHWVVIECTEMNKDIYNT